MILLTVVIRLRHRSDRIYTTSISYFQCFQATLLHNDDNMIAQCANRQKRLSVLVYPIVYTHLVLHGGNENKNNFPKFCLDFGSGIMFRCARNAKLYTTYNSTEQKGYWKKVWNENVSIWSPHHTKYLYIRRYIHVCLNIFGILYCNRTSRKSI